MPIRQKHHNHRWDRQIPIDHTGFFPYHQRYLEALMLKGYSEATRYRHDNHLRGFVAWCDERSLESPHVITKPILERYRKHLYYHRKSTGDSLAFTSQKAMLSSLRSFFKWLTQENHIPSNPASELSLPKAPKRLPRTVLSQEEVTGLCRQPDITTVSGLRDRCILEVFYSCGLRRTELAKLTLYDVHLARGLIVVREGKGGQDRLLPIGDHTRSWLIRYQEEARDALSGPLDDERWFITDYGEPFNGGLLGRLVKKYLVQAGIVVTGSCHLLRHAMATHMLENGADIRFIQTMLGHRELTSTEIYTHVSVEHLRRVHARTHPREVMSDRHDADKEVPVDGSEGSDS